MVCFISAQLNWAFLNFNFLLPPFPWVQGVHKPCWMVGGRILLEQGILEGGSESLHVRAALTFNGWCARVHEGSRLTSYFGIVGAINFLHVYEN